MANTIQLRRGVYSSLPTLYAGELGFSTDTKQLHIGDGATNHEVLMHNKFDANTILYATSDNTPEAKTRAQLLALLSGQLTQDFSVNSNKLTNLTDPSSNQDAATKAYVDTVAQGLDGKDSCRVATTEALPANTASGSGVGKTLTMDSAAVLTVDGVNTVLGDRILVKNESTGSNNGIYSVTTEGTVSVATVLTRSIDFDESSEVTSGAYTFISEGTTNLNQGWILSTNDPITIDSTSLSFTQFSGAASLTAGTGLSRSGNTLNVGAGDGIQVNADTVEVLYGTSVNTACVGNDSRLSDTRDPNNHASSHVTGGTDVIPAAISGGNSGLLTGTDKAKIDTIIADTLFNAHTMLYSVIDNTPASLTIGEQSIVGRITGGNIAALTGSNVWTILSGSASANVSMNSKKLTSLTDPEFAQDAATKAYVDNQLAAQNSFVELSDTPSTYSGEALKLTRVNATQDALEFVNFATTYLEASPTNGETGKAPNSDWAYDHSVATTGVHGAGANTLLHSGSTIDGGSF